jgi:hypothetical protein
MPSEIVQRRVSTPRPTVMPRRTVRALLGEQHSTLMRIARVQGEEIVATEKLHSIDHLTREAMSGHAMLRKWADTLATSDPFLADELKFFTDMARLGKGEIIADTISTYCRESRGL